MRLIDAAKFGAEHVRASLYHSDCECEGGHCCGLVERQKELIGMESAISRAEREQNAVRFDIEFVGLDGLNHRIDEVRLSDVETEVFNIEGRGGHSVVLYGWVE